MKAVNINDKGIGFTELILSGLKTIETRRTRSLDSLIGQRVGIIRTGAGKATLVGYVTIAGIKQYDTDSFRKDYEKHRVPEGSQYDIAPGGIKYGYILRDPERCTPVEVKAKGIVIRNI